MDNGGTFIKAAKWLSKVPKDKLFQSQLEDNNIKWIFNLSRAPWWGRHLIGKGILCWNELSEVLLDVEIQVNRRPMSHVEEDVELPVLTTANFLFQRTTKLPEIQPYHEEEKDLRKRLKFLKNCKDQLRNRWRREYLRALRERHVMINGTNGFQVSKGDVVVVQTYEKNRGCWPLAMVIDTYRGNDAVTRAVRIRTSKGEIERPVQHLYPLELACDKYKETEQQPKLNPNAPAFRQRRDAAVAADEKSRKYWNLNSRKLNFIIFDIRYRIFYNY